jgi:hypothetical protein
MCPKAAPSRAGSRCRTEACASRSCVATIGSVNPVARCRRLSTHSSDAHHNAVLSDLLNLRSQVIGPPSCMGGEFSLFGCRRNSLPLIGGRTKAFLPDLRWRRKVRMHLRMVTGALTISRSSLGPPSLRHEPKLREEHDERFKRN